MKMWKNEVTNVHIVSVVIGAFGMVSKNISRYLEIIGFSELEKLQKTRLSRTVRILREILGYND